MELFSEIIRLILSFLSSSELKGTLSLPWSLTLTVPLSVAAQLSQILHQVLLSLLLIMAYCIGCLMDMDLRDCFPFCHFQAKSGKCDFLPSWRELEISWFFHENLYGFIREAGNNVVSHFLESPLSVSINLPSEIMSLSEVFWAVSGLSRSTENCSCKMADVPFLTWSCGQLANRIYIGPGRWKTLGLELLTSAAFDIHPN